MMLSSQIWTANKVAAPIYAPLAISQAGGDLISVTWEWPTAGPYVATLTQGDQTLPLTSGLTGAPLGPFSPLGQPLRLFLPPLPSTEPAALLLALASAPSSPAAILPLQVVADFYWAQMFSLRSLFPTPWSVGPRSMAVLPAPV